MNPRQACFACLERDPPAVFEAALWIAAEHDPSLCVEQTLRELGALQQQVAAVLPELSHAERAQALLRRLSALGFHQASDGPLRPHAALLHRVLHSRHGQPLSLALIALELAQRLRIPLVGVNFPGHFLLRVPGADHLLDPCGGRRLYTRDCRELLQYQLGAQAELNGGHLAACDPRSLLQRLSRNLRQLHRQDDDDLAALKDAERVLQLGPPSVADHLARADIYQDLDCLSAERFDLERALLLSDDPAQRHLLGQRLLSRGKAPAVH